jgi:hypothetical protein
MNSDRELLRHTLATLAYRASRALEEAPESFAAFDGAGRPPGQILAHMGDLFDWALSMAEGNQRWHNSEALVWPEEQRRFFALTHVGQLAMLRRLAGCPIRGENYYVAEIALGNLSAEQPVPVKPFR